MSMYPIDFIFVGLKLMNSGFVSISMLWNLGLFLYPRYDPQGVLTCFDLGVGT